MISKKKYNLLFNAILSSLAFMVFAFFIHYKFPIKLISFSALLFPAWIFSRNLKSISDIRMIIGSSVSYKITSIYSAAGLLLGTLLAVLYRGHLGISLFPKSLHLFVIAAAAIGCTEELVFRGFIQDYAKSISGPFSVLFSTISHTGYKCCLFLSPAITGDINIAFLVIWTMIAGIIAGTLKHRSKSILPPLIAHGLFDILVYAEYIKAPWWVW